MMPTLRWIVGIAIGVATLCLVAVYVASSWYMALAMVGIGLLWLSVLRHGNSRVADLGFFFLVLAAVWGGMQNLAWGWLLTGVVAGLVGWDLTHYLAHLQTASERRDESALVGSHLRRLAGVAVGGWLLAGLTLSATLRFNYLWALVLGGVGIFFLTQAVRSLRRRTLD